VKWIDAMHDALCVGGAVAMVFVIRAAWVLYQAPQSGAVSPAGVLTPLFIAIGCTVGAFIAYAAIVDQERSAKQGS